MGIYWPNFANHDQGADLSMESSQQVPGQVDSLQKQCSIRGVFHVLTSVYLKD